MLDRRLAGQEPPPAWQEGMEKRVARGVGVPLLASNDGPPGRHGTLRAPEPQLPLQRGTAHKRRKLLSRAPAHLREEVAADYRRMSYGKNPAVGERARRGVLKNWRLRRAAVAASVEGAGEAVVTFLSFPPAQGKGLRTTTARERSNEEVRRRTKPQASLPTEEAVVRWLFGLLRRGQVVRRRFAGWQAMPSASPLIHKQAA